MSDWDPQIDADEHELADRLAGERPVPAAEFRGALGRHLAANDPGYGPRPARLGAIVGGYLGVGGVLIALGVLQGLGQL